MVKYGEDRHGLQTTNLKNLGLICNLYFTLNFSRRANCDVATRTCTVNTSQA